MNPKVIAIFLLAFVLAACSQPQSPQIQPETTSPNEIPIWYRTHSHPQVPPLGEPAEPTESAKGMETLCESECAAERTDTLYVQSLRPKLTRGSNSQLQLPRNLYLADVDADGQSDYVQYAGNKIFVSKTDFDKTGILHYYTSHAIERLITGDFSGDGRDQVCLIDKRGALKCYGVSSDRKELWWWFTQSAFTNTDEDTIVGDFDGDGRDDILVYPRGGGPFRMYSVKGSAFFRSTPNFAQGNLAGSNGPELQVRAGDFNADGRDDVLIINPWGQVLRYSSVYSRDEHTFWWAFTTASGVVTPDDQVTVARIDDNDEDDVVLHNRKTGATRFHALRYDNAQLPRIPITIGQIYAGGNSLIAWVAPTGGSEPGAQRRDGAMVYNLSTNMFHRASARHNGSNFTYWWAYTQHAPNNHFGWLEQSEKPWLFLKCKFPDIEVEPQDDDFYQELSRAHSRYWWDISYGSWNLTGSRVVDAWHTMGMTNEAWRNKEVSRWQRAGACMEAYGSSTSGYVNTVALVNGEGDAGNSGGRVLLTPDSTNLTSLAHETGHTFGWGHSFDDSSRKLAPWSGPGEYYDEWDIMSAMNVQTFVHGLGVRAGPGMSAPFLTKESFIPSHRITVVDPKRLPSGHSVSLAAVNRPEANGALMLRIGTNDAEYFTLEYRVMRHWDQGIRGDAVLIHRVVDGTPYLISKEQTGWYKEKKPGSVTQLSLQGQTFEVEVGEFAEEGFTAEVLLRR